MPSRKYDVAVDGARNRMYVILRGFLSAAEVRDTGRCIMDGLSRLRPGFDMVTDLSEAQGTDPEGLEELRRIQEHVATHGVRRAVRVVPPVFAALLQMWRTSREFGYAAEIAVSIADARKMLDAAPPQPVASASPA